MSQFPAGPITLLMTDIVGSTALWERDLDAMNRAVERHDELVAECVEAHGGRLIKERGEGDSHLAVFQKAANAVAAMLAVQRAMDRESWSVDPPLRVRAAVHTGEVFARGGDLYGPTINRCGRLRAAAHDGQALVSNAAQELMREAVPEGAELRNLGQHRLKDLLQPEHIFELVHDATPPDLPPIKTLNVRPHNLPIQLTSFVGCVATMRQIRESLQRNRLVTLLGPGGCGKTRLSLQVAAELVEEYPDGVWQIELAALPSHAEVSGAIASALSITESPGMSVSVAVVRALEEKRILLLLDNCEHVVDDAARAATAILHGCAGVTLLATSRTRLGVPGEASSPIPPMEVPDDKIRDAQNLMQTESVRLFCDRAHDRDPAFTLTDQNAEPIATLCRRLNGIPLAIEFVASTIGLLTPVQILERWESKSLELGTDDRTVDPRHQTLRACIDWSVELLSDSARQALGDLAVFVSGWTLEAAERVLADGDETRMGPLKRLQELTAFSLVLVDPDCEGGRRYRYLETVRQYALEQLGEPDEGLLVRFCDWALEFAGKADPELAGPDQALWLDRIEADRENLRRAFELLMLREPERALRLAQHLRRFWIRRGPLREGRLWFERALGAARHLDDSFQADALNTLGAFCSLQFDSEGAAAAYQASLALWTKLGDKAKMARMLTNMGILESQSERYDRALELLAESLELYGELGDESGRASAMLNIGTTQLEVGLAEKAVPSLTEALGLLERVGEPAWIAACRMNRGRAHVRLHDVKAAVSDFREALRLQTRVGDPVVTGHVLTQIAWLASRREALVEAAFLLLGSAESCLEPSGVQPWAGLVPEIETRGAQLGDSVALARARAVGRSMATRDAVLKGLETCDLLTVEGGLY